LNLNGAKNEQDVSLIWKQRHAVSVIIDDRILIF